MRVGVLGGGQLGRMLALAGYPLGLDFRFLESKEPAPVDGLGEVVRAGYDEPDALQRFAVGLDVVTYEFENVPVSSAEALASELPVFPPPQALAMAQDRLREKEAFQALGVPTAPFHAVDTVEDLRQAVAALGLPAVLKTRRLGYDGKGQAVLRDDDEVEGAWNTLGGQPLLLERFIEFERELSILGVRGRDGETAFYPLVENTHRDGILRHTIAPAPHARGGLQEVAEGYARALMESLDYVGVLALELFQHGADLLANEVAPRVHNSGHWTQNGAVCSQFENHLRAVCGLPLGSTEARAHAAMVNLIGWVPPAEELVGRTGTYLHLYGKEVRPGRKLGHVNVVGDDPDDILEVVAEIEAHMQETAGLPH